jgi:hypothetical protein
MSLFGIGTGFVYLTVIRNCWKYFPDKKGAISGLILAGYGLSAMIFTSIADEIVNPGGHILPDKEGFYPQQIAENVHYFIYLEFVIFTIAGIVAVFLIFSYDKELKASNEENSQFDLDKNDNIDENFINGSNFSQSKTKIYLIREFS